MPAGSLSLARSPVVAGVIRKPKAPSAACRTQPPQNCGVQKRGWVARKASRKGQMHSLRPRCVFAMKSLEKQLPWPSERFSKGSARRHVGA